MKDEAPGMDIDKNNVPVHSLLPHLTDFKKRSFLLRFLDILLTIVHLAIVGFNLFGWIWPRARRAHLIVILLTAASWFVLGIWYGIGYCPVTDWQWRVKEQLGERNLPASFITYYAERITGRDFSDSFINTVTSAAFAVAALLAMYFNFIKKRTRNLLQKSSGRW